jgi:hypothetical protein
MAPGEIKVGFPSIKAITVPSPEADQRKEEEQDEEEEDLFGEDDIHSTDSPAGSGMGKFATMDFDLDQSQWDLDEVHLYFLLSTFYSLLSSLYSLLPSSCSLLPALCFLHWIQWLDR